VGLGKNKTKIGHQGEEIAVAFLQKRGYRILERNFRLAYGEIDIIAQDGSFLVFVEVKLRQDDNYGSGKEAINRKKIARIEQVGEYYATLHPELPQALRIDVLVIEPKDKEGKLKTRLFKNIQKDF